MYSPVPFIAKELSEDFYVEGDRIPKGTSLRYTSLYSLLISIFI